MSDIITFPETPHVDELSFKIYPDGSLDVDFESAEGGHIAGRHLARADVERVYDALGRVLRGASTEPAKPQPGPGWDIGWAIVPYGKGGDLLSVLGILDAGVFHYIAPSGARLSTVDYTDFEPGA
jgi:hypothetical protein